MLGDNNCKIKSNYQFFLGRTYSNGRHSAAPPSAQSSFVNHNQLWSRGVLGHCIDATKTSSGKVQMLVFEIKSAYQFIQTCHF